MTFLPLSLEKTGQNYERKPQSSSDSIGRLFINSNISSYPSCTCAYVIPGLCLTSKSVPINFCRLSTGCGANFPHALMRGTMTVACSVWRHALMLTSLSGTGRDDRLYQWDILINDTGSSASISLHPVSPTSLQPTPVLSGLVHCRSALLLYLPPPSACSLTSPLPSSPFLHPMPSSYNLLLLSLSLPPTLLCPQLHPAQRSTFLY